MTLTDVVSVIVAYKQINNNNNCIISFQALRVITLAVISMEAVNMPASQHQMDLDAAVLKALCYVKRHHSVLWQWVRFDTVSLHFSKIYG